jgi:hypothetical protein
MLHATCSNYAQTELADNAQEPLSSACRSFQAATQSEHAGSSSQTRSDGASRQRGLPPLELSPCSLVTARVAAPAWASRPGRLRIPRAPSTLRRRGKLNPRAAGKASPQTGAQRPPHRRQAPPSRRARPRLRKRSRRSAVAGSRGSPSARSARLHRSRADGDGRGRRVRCRPQHPRPKLRKPECRRPRSRACSSRG